MSSDPVTYFRYNDPKTGRDFYFNSVTRETVWIYPMDGVVLDPNTMEKVESPRRRSGVRHRSHTVAPPAQDGVEARTREKPKKSISSGKRRRASVSRTGLRSRQGKDLPSVMTTFKNRLTELSAERFDVDAFVNEHFRKPKGKPKVPLAEFSGDAISDSLLANLNKNASKEAVKAFKAMLKSVKDKKEKNEIVAVVEACRKEPELVDEVLCQCIKQTSEAPHDAMVPYLSAILIIVTLFLPSPFVHEYLFWHLAMCSKHETARVKQLAEFAFIRLLGTIDNEKPCFEWKTPEEIMAIKTHPALGNIVFGSGLTEIFWVQSRTHPNCPIPFVMHEMAEAMLELGAENTQGIFRLPGNLGKLDDMAARANRGERYLDGANAHDVASLFKKWIREIPGSVLGRDKTTEITSVKSDDNAQIVAVANTLPFERRAILMYLVGFLRRMAKSEAVTLMGIPNLAMVFAPNISYIPSDASPLNQAAMTNSVKTALAALIVSWDVSQIYPLNENLAQ